jgi:hypothetical protein
VRCVHHKGEEVILITQPEIEAFAQEEDGFEPLSTVHDMPIPDPPKVCLLLRRTDYPMHSNGQSKDVDESAKF